MRIADNAEMLEIKSGSSTLYPVLTWDADSLVLIDAGYPGQTDLIVRAIKNARFKPENLTDIILTHQDLDHIGCVKDLLRLAPSAHVIAHEKEAPYINGIKSPIKGFPSQNITVTQTVSDGEVLPIGGGIEVVHTPGHTPGHICLFLRSSRIMVCGDAVNLADGCLVGPNPVYTHDMAAGLVSLERVKGFDLAAVATYHCGYLNLAE